MADQMILTPYFLDDLVPGLYPLADTDWQVIEIELPSGEKQARMAVLYESLANAVATAVSAGNRPVSIAGDCCTTVGVVAGLQRAGLSPNLLWLDAHGDFNTWITTPSGFLGGMPLAMLVGKGEQTLLDALGLRPLPESSVWLSDARDLDPGEKLLLADSDVTLLPDAALLLENRLPPGPIYVHFDTDIINLADAPAMNYPAAGGPSLQTLRQVFQRLADSGQVTAVSVSTWNPELDENGRSQQTVMALLDILLSRSPQSLLV